MTHNQTELFKHATPIAESKIRQARAIQAAATWEVLKKVGGFIATVFRSSEDVSKRCAEL